MPDVPRANVQTNPHVFTPTQIAQYAKDAGFPTAAIPVATAIALAESGGRNTATHKNTNGSTDYGLWQINTVHPDVLAMGDWRDPGTNARMAFAVYQQAGGKFTPWSTFNSGSYKSHLSAAAPAGSQVSGTTNGPLSGFNLGSLITDLGKLFDPALWKRIGIGALGVLLLIIAAYALFGSAERKVITQAIPTPKAPAVPKVKV